MSKPSGQTSRERRAAARKAARDAERRRAARRPRWLPLVAVAAIAVLVVGGLIWLGNRSTAPTAVDVPTEGMVKGLATAPVTIEEWADFQCPACRQFTFGPGQQLDQSAIKPGQARLVWHDMAFLGQESVWAAEAARCANDQGRFWQYHDKLYADQRGENQGAFAKANLERFAGEIGLDRATFDPCLESDRHLAEVQADIQQGQRRGVDATPTFFVNGQKLVGVPTAQQLLQVVATAAGGP